MADEVRKSLNVESSLHRGAGGVFIVEVDGTAVYDKKKTGRFPNPGEIVDLIQSR